MAIGQKNFIRSCAKRIKHMIKLRTNQVYQRQKEEK